MFPFRIALVLLCVSSVVFAATSQPRPAAGFNYRLYSNATEEGYPYAQTGVYSYHAFGPVTASPGFNCSVFASNDSNFVVFDQWVIQNLGGPANQVEIGVVNQCSNAYVYRFAAVWKDGLFYVLSRTLIAPDLNGHYFDLHRISSGGFTTWHFWYDGVEIAAMDWNMAGVRINVGLESSDSNAQVPSHWFSLLKFTQNELPWQDFGTGAPTFILTSPMCGYYETYYTRWAAGQPSGTC